MVHDYHVAIQQAGMAFAGKLGCLSALLQGIVSGTRERAVVVASSTAALNIVQSRCHEQGLTTCRIDGATPPAKRQDIVDAFNHHHVGQAGHLKSLCLP